MLVSKSLPTRRPWLGGVFHVRGEVVLVNILLAKLKEEIAEQAPLSKMEAYASTVQELLVKLGCGNGLDQISPLPGGADAPAAIAALSGQIRKKLEDNYLEHIEYFHAMLMRICGSGLPAGLPDSALMTAASSLSTQRNSDDHPAIVRAWIGLAEQYRSAADSSHEAFIMLKYAGQLKDSIHGVMHVVLEGLARATSALESIQTADLDALMDAVSNLCGDSFHEEVVGSQRYHITKEIFATERKQFVNRKQSAYKELHAWRASLQLALLVHKAELKNKEVLVDWAMQCVKLFCAVGLPIMLVFAALLYLVLCYWVNFHSLSLGPLYS